MSSTHKRFVMDVIIQVDCQLEQVLLHRMWLACIKPFCTKLDRIEFGSHGRGGRGLLIWGLVF